MLIEYRETLDRIDWEQLKQALATDRFDNGRSPWQLEQSFKNSYAICFALHNTAVIGTARILSDAVCNAYLVDVWTRSTYRRQGIGSTMVERLCMRIPGQHLFLQADGQAVEFYRRIGFTDQPHGLGRVIGNWLDPDSPS